MKIGMSHISEKKKSRQALLLRSCMRLTVIARERGKPLPGVAGFGIEETVWQDHDSLAAEHAAFVASVLDGAPVLVDAAAGRCALAAALMVTDGIAAARARMVASGLIEQIENSGGGGG